MYLAMETTETNTPPNGLLRCFGIMTMQPMKRLLFPRFFRLVKRTAAEY
jgi:hypothetical protein